MSEVIIIADFVGACCLCHIHGVICLKAESTREPFGIKREVIASLQLFATGVTVHDGALHQTHEEEKRQELTVRQ